jgi:hypothetical protein
VIKFTIGQRSFQQIQKFIRQKDHRLRRGEELFLLEVATYLCIGIWGKKAKAPKIGDKGWDYTQHLRISLLDGTDGNRPAVAIWVEADAQVLKARDVSKTILRVKPSAEAPPWVQLLETWGWFPAFLLPAQPERGMAKVLARSVRPQEAKALREKYDPQYKDLMQQLLDAGAPKPKRKRAATDMPVYVDLAWEILRAELGLGSGRGRKHWRPAIRRAMKYVPIAGEHFVSYLMDGNEGWFDVQYDGRIGWKQVQEGIHFQRELMPFVKA